MFSLSLASAFTAPKKVLIVSITTGFRHSSIETGEKILEKLGKESGKFTVDFVRQPSAPPSSPKEPKKNEKLSDEKFSELKNLYHNAMALYLPQRQKWEKEITDYAAEHLSMDKLRQYDAFIFCNTTGELPFPDPQGFIKLIEEEGKGFIAVHSGSDTFHRFRPYVDMLGGEFATHKAQVAVTPKVHDDKHPATKPWPKEHSIFDEIYIIKSYDPQKVHGLLGLNEHPNDKTPGYFPISWTKHHGKGRVFYSSLGHREDVWDDTWKAGQPDRKNSPETSLIYQKHLLGGILWALGLEEGDTTLGNVK